ncbi:MAG: hypothetical protein KDB61_03820, partial [Planctomycetes bacterium]|nr:hypothetical protein [Planctomycetota bacterium]
MKNNNASLFLTLLVGILIGTGLGYMFGGSQPVQADGPHGMSNGVTRTQAESQRAPTPEVKLVADHSESVREKPAKAAPTRVSEAEVSGLLSKVSLDDVQVEEGEGVLFGRVVDKRGQALAGVVIRAVGSTDRNSARSPSDVGRAAPVIKSLKETVREAAQNYQDARSRTVEVTTDAAGEYRLEGLPDNLWRLTAFLDEYEVSPDNNTGQGRIGMEINFTAKPVLQVPVVISLPDGTQPSLATLSVDRSGDNNRSRIYVWSARESFLRLVPGRYEVRGYSHAESGTDRAEMASEPTKIVVKEGQAPETLELALLPRNGITGYVRGPKRSEADVNYNVRLMALAPEQEINLEALSNS